jgi:hypothetical protein
MNEHYAREGARAQRPRDVGRDRLVIVTVDRERLCNHAFVSHSRLPFSVSMRYRLLRENHHLALGRSAQQAPITAALVNDTEAERVPTLVKRRIQEFPRSQIRRVKTSVTSITQ